MQRYILMNVSRDDFKRLCAIYGEECITSLYQENTECELIALDEQVISDHVEYMCWEAEKLPYLINPSNAVIEYAISIHPRNILYYSNIAQHVLIQALEQAPEYISHIRKLSPFEEMMLISDNPDNFRYISNPSYETRKFAIKISVACLNDIYNITEEECSYAIALYGDDVIPNIRNTPYVFSNENLHALIEIYPHALVRLINYASGMNKMSDSLIEHAVRKMPQLIRIVKEPSEEIQMVAVMGDPNVINLIKEPTLKVCEYAILTSIGLLRKLPPTQTHQCVDTLERMYNDGKNETNPSD